MSDEELMSAMRAVVREEVDRAAESIARATLDAIAELRQEMVDNLVRLERRTERVENNTNAALMQLAGISKSLTVAEREAGATGATLAAQQRAIDDLARRVSELEKRAN